MTSGYGDEETNRFYYGCEKLKKEEDFNLDKYAKEVYDVEYRMPICSDCDEEQKQVSTGTTNEK